MTGWGQVLIAGLINWFVTTIFVESHLFAPIRNWVIVRTWYVTGADNERHRVGGVKAYVWPEGTTQEEFEAAVPYHWGPWFKLAQLITCQMCTRTWVGFAEAFVFGGPFTGQWHQFLSNGLLYAAVGHLIFELRSRVALVVPNGEDDAHSETH